MKVLTVILLYILLFNNCRSDDCHQEFTFINNSLDTIYYAQIFYEGNTSLSKCELSGTLIAPEDDYIEWTRGCWESELASDHSFTFYIVSRNGLNNQGFYDCDSVFLKNVILKEYILTLDTLINSNWTITYP